LVAAACLIVAYAHQRARSLSVSDRASCQIANPTAINPNAIDTAAAIASNVHMAISSDGQFTAANWLIAIP
jgi:hypothetical protein